MMRMVPGHVGQLEGGGRVAVLGVGLGTAVVT